MRRVALAAGVAVLALAPLALGAVPLWPVAVAVGVAAAAVGVVGVWKAPEAALAVAAAAATLVAADLATRPLLDRVHVRAEDRYARLWRVDPPAARHEPDIDVAWPTVGNLGALGGAVRQPRTVGFRTDARGFRTDPLPGPARVVLLGDSFGAGVGSSQEVMAAALLTTRYGLPTVNLSLSGASPYDEAVTLASVLGDLDLAPDAVIVWMLFAGNDFTGECHESLPPPPSAWNRARAWVATLRVRSVVGYLLRRIRADPPVPVVARLADGTGMSFYPPDLDLARLSEADVRALPTADCVREAVRLVAGLAEAAGLPLVVAVAPMKVQVYGPHVGMGAVADGAAATLRAFAAEEGLVVIDLEPALAEAARAGLPDRLVWWRDDTHWNADGHAVAAQAVADALTDESGRSVR